jgi:HD-GYP domain-containing protein (c-di-GMP phosphodiesterase class II)
MAMQSRIQLALAGLCFDLGATLLPEDATPAMWRRHPLLSVDLLAVHTEDGLLRAAVSGHHERMDGAGEPVGTHALPLAARMASLCDRAVDAFSAPAIGPPPPPYLALERLADDSGAHDPRLFLELVRLLARRDTAWRHGN